MDRQDKSRPKLDMILIILPILEYFMYVYYLPHILLNCPRSEQKELTTPTQLCRTNETEAPVPPVNLLGDFAAGGLLCVGE